MLICVPRFVGKGFSLTPNVTRPYRPAMTVYFGACTPRLVLVPMVSWLNPAIATIALESVTAPGNAAEAQYPVSEHKFAHWRGGIIASKRLGGGLLREKFRLWPLFHSFC
jgi:hypothetical protein